jgi:hypothetical protein
MKAAIAIAVLAASTCCGDAGAAAIPPCRALEPVVDVSVADIPPVMMTRLKHDLGTFALPGEPFDATPQIRTGIYERLIWVRRRGVRWAVAIQNGGRLHNQMVIAYEILPGDRVMPMSTVGARPATLCQLTERQLWRPAPDSGLSKSGSTFAPATRSNF